MSAAGFVVTWFGEGPREPASSDVGSTQSGAPMTGDFQVNTATCTTSTIRPDVGDERRRRFRRRVGRRESVSSSTALGRRYDSAGTPLGDVFPISGTSLAALDPKVASDSAGNFVVTWSTSSVLLGEGGGTDDNSAVRARLYDIGGVAVSAEFVVNEITTGLQCRARPSLADDGSFVVAFNERIGLRYDVKGAQERRPGGAGDHGRSAPRSRLRTDGRQ